ncbi:MAG: hypothetical protein COT74_05505 [Bdellovibrionales bacterium CG10_big_fil_rev_8_21_14_0_10_45_34]|nr:MAG: hypothetical protein COT74_05505 [Bdellovibrionales bacterium CG10_big_fil_rev_8_21_14_0_10_45_34]
MKRIALLGLCVTFSLAYFLYLSTYRAATFTESLEAPKKRAHHRYRGITHIHSLESTGSESQAYIIQVAKDMGFDFIFFTEVNPREQKPSAPYYSEDLLVIPGGEYTYMDSRILQYNVSAKNPPETRGQSQIYFADRMSQRLSDEEGFIALAHPLLRNHAWSGDLPKGMDAIEVVNLKRMIEASWTSRKFSFVLSSLLFPISPQLALINLYQNPDEEFALLDRAQAERSITGMFGSDATAKAIIFGNTHLKIPSYEQTFAVGSNYVLLKSELTGNSDQDAKKIISALKHGNSFMAFDLLGRPDEFSAAYVKGRKNYMIGEKIARKAGDRIVVDMPSTPVVYEVTLLRDGVHEAFLHSRPGEFEITRPGIYRVVVRFLLELPLPFGKKWMPWIYTNSFFVE